jgi:hypothetical protein
MCSGFRAGTDRGVICERRPLRLPGREGQQSRDDQSTVCDLTRARLASGVLGPCRSCRMLSPSRCRRSDCRCRWLDGAAGTKADERRDRLETGEIPSSSMDSLSAHIMCLMMPTCREWNASGNSFRILALQLPTKSIKKGSL